MPVDKNLTHIESGPAELTFGSTALGVCSGDIHLNITPTLREVTSAHTGDTPLDYIVTGARVEVICKLAEYVLQNLAAAIPYGTLATEYHSLGSLGGERLSNFAATLTIHPVDLDAADTSRDVTIHNAVCVNIGAVTFSKKQDRLIEVKFAGLLDISRNSGDMLTRINSISKGD